MHTEHKRLSVDIATMTDEARHRVLVEWNNTKAEYPRDSCIHQVFEAQANRTPDAVAVVLPGVRCGEDDSEQLTYDELNRQGNELAYHLLRLGIQPDALVAMYMERSIEMIVAILGVLKAGAAYVPLDPSYPKHHLAFMLDDTKAEVLLTQSQLVEGLPVHHGRVMCLDAGWGASVPVDIVNPDCDTNATNLGYVMYTSGSTGGSKGVAVTHRGVLRLVLGTNYAKLNANQVILQLAPISFDAATFEIWGALLHGACCVLFPKNGVPDPKELGAIIEEYHVSILWLTASLFNTLIDEAPEVLSGVRELLIGGEALSVTHTHKALQLLPETQLINGYGPTENTTFTCCYQIPRRLGENLASIPIGRPIANTETYILDSHLHPVPIGVEGELYVGGDGLARGYLNRPELTAELFIRHPFRQDPRARLYKTGDKVRYLPDGNIEFIGREDDQVKIHGYRVELGEIESVLERHDSVRDAVVIMRKDKHGNQRLVAFVTPVNETQPNTNVLRAYLNQKFSNYMVPAAFVLLDKIPLTPNGKADRRALQIPDDFRTESEDNFVPPRSVSEMIMAEIWCEVLGHELVGVQDNFFELGGTSLLAIKVITRMREKFGDDTNLSVLKLFEYSTIGELASYMDGCNSAQSCLKKVQTRGKRQKAAFARRRREL